MRDLVSDARQRDAYATAQLLSRLRESDDILEAFGAAPGDIGHVIGVTGPPGAGKSTLVSALIQKWREAGLSVAVLAVDPSSPRTGGSLLGDRIRMRSHALDPDVFIRSMPTNSQLGGLATTTPAAVDLLIRCGWDLVVVETVGVGQSEVDIMTVADTTVVISAPGAGDAVQISKAGLMEVADIHCVNKADDARARRTVSDLQRFLHMTGAPGEDGAGWSPKVVSTVATDGEVDQLLDAISSHHDWLVATDALAERRLERTATELRSRLGGLLVEWLHKPQVDTRIRNLAATVTAGERSRGSAVSSLAASFGAEHGDGDQRAAGT